MFCPFDALPHILKAFPEKENKFSDHTISYNISSFNNLFYRAFPLKTKMIFYLEALIYIYRQLPCSLSQWINFWWFHHVYLLFVISIIFYIIYQLRQTNEATIPFSSLFNIFYFGILQSVIKHCKLILFMLCFYFTKC